MEKTKTKKVVKACGCEEPIMTQDDMSFTVKRVMCKKHAEQFKRNYPTS